MQARHQGPELVTGSLVETTGACTDRLDRWDRVRQPWRPSITDLGSSRASSSARRSSKRLCRRRPPSHHLGAGAGAGAGAGPLGMGAAVESRRKGAPRYPSHPISSNLTSLLGAA